MGGRLKREKLRRIKERKQTFEYFDQQTNDKTHWQRQRQIMARQDQMRNEEGKGESDKQTDDQTELREKESHNKK